MKLERTTTGLIIHGPDEIIKRKILQYFSLSNPLREYFIYSGNDKSRKPIFGNEHDVVYISSGFLNVNDGYIRSLPRPSTIQPIVPERIQITMNRQPRSKLQEDCIKMMTNKIQSNYKTTIELKPGVGKTFIATYAISILGLKPLIVAPTTLLKNQWVENFMDTGISRDNIATNIYDAPSKSLAVVTVSSIENALRDDWEGLMAIINKSGFGIKVVDEAHLHLKGILRFDAICNIRYNWYLSATLGRSDVQEDNILNRALSDAERFIGNSEYEEYQHQYINVIFQDIYYYPTNKLCAENFRYGSKGLIKASYYNMLMKYYNGEPLIRNILNVTKICRNMVTYGKIVVVMPLLNIIYRVLEAFKEDPYFHNLKIGAIDGSMPLSQRREIMDGDIILSTIQSIGTGVDIPGLSVLINFDAFKSPITSEQCVGRLRRRKDDKDCYYVDVCDHVKQAKTITNWVLSRQSLLTYFPGVRSNVKRFPDIRS